MASEMIERVAQTIEPAAWKPSDGRPGGEAVLENRRRLARAKAARVLRTLRMPVVEMIDAAQHGPGKPTHTVITGIWARMIDAALDEPR